MKTRNNYRQIMKITAYIVLALLPYTGIAQNYQCLQSGVKHYFTNSDGYLRGIRIDSVKSYADSAVFYPYHTSRGRYYISDTLGGSWLGKRVLQLNDGTFLFDNIWNDTAIIKTQAHTGDKWNLYDDTTTFYYEAEVVAEDTMTVIGSVDSVKKILITARDPSGIVATDPVNGFQIVLSKNNGFVQVFDLYTFPYHAPDSLYKVGAVDNFLDLIGGPSLAKSVFSLAPFKWPTKTELYNWNVGDAYEIQYCLSARAYLDCPYPSHFDYDSIVSKVVFPDSIQYTTVGWTLRQVYPLPSPLPDKFYPYEYSGASKTFTVPNIPLFDTSLFPEQYGQDTTYYYYPYDTTFCITGEKYYTARLVRWEGSGPFYAYKKDINLVYEYIDPPTGISYGKKLIYYNHSGISCGGHVGPEILSAKDVTNKPHSISLSPNPASDIITLTAPEKISQLAITDIVGQVIFKSNYQTDKVQLDISRFAPGMYIAKINGVEALKFIRQ